MGHYVLMGPRCWGSGSDMDGAKREFKHQGGRLTEEHVALRFEPQQDWRVRWDGAIEWSGPPPEVVIDRRKDRSEPFVPARKPDTEG